MHSVILPIIFVAVSAAKLDNAYLPPSTAKDAGGRDDDLQVPLEPPYIDPYSDSRYPLPGRPNFRRKHPIFIKDEDQILVPEAKGRFLYGSYSYTGPDNVVVTVTYRADQKKPKSRRRLEDYDYDYDFGGRRLGGYGYDADEEEEPSDVLEGGVVPTPPGLPRELQKAFAFHRRKVKTSKNDSRKVEPDQPWSEQPIQKPVIHQGYSYPKIRKN